MHLKKERFNTIKMILKNLDEHYPPELNPRVSDMALLMESDLNKLLMPKSAMHAILFSMKSSFRSKIEEYPNLKKYPNILYQILRKSLLSQSKQQIVVQEDGKLPTLHHRPLHKQASLQHN